ncbi:MAG: OB-fold domain-containing protein [Chloroflexi bacterium]|nr:OB-fold domain-containing protein [Chloroflexota bacterium]
MTQDVKDPAGKPVSFDKRVLKIPEGTDGSYYLLGNKCEACGNVYFPQRFICTTCFRDDTLREVPLSRQGRLYSYSITRREFLAPPGFTVPYAFGYIDLPEGVRVLARLKEWEPDLLRVDLLMEIGVETVGQDKTGNPVIGYFFKPAAETAAGKAAIEIKEVSGHEESRCRRGGDDRIREVSREDGGGAGCCS